MALVEDVPPIRQVNILARPRNERRSGGRPDLVGSSRSHKAAEMQFGLNKWTRRAYRQQARLFQVVVQQAALQAVGGTSVGGGARHTRQVQSEQHLFEQRHRGVLHAQDGSWKLSGMAPGVGGPSVSSICPVAGALNKHTCLARSNLTSEVCTVAEELQPVQTAAHLQVPVLVRVVLLLAATLHVAAGRREREGQPR